MAVPSVQAGNRLGVLGGDLAGFPNGRRLADDVIGITLRAAQGALLPNPPAAVNTNHVAFRGAFPYLAVPNMTSVNQ
jgi:hypothetical protein